MISRYLRGCLAIATSGILLTPASLLADTRDRGISHPNSAPIDAIFHVGPDFFEQGREQFELEIDRLQQRQFEAAAPPLLTVDESLQFDADAVEDLWELPPVTPDADRP